MRKLISTIYQDGVKFTLYMEDGEGYVIYEDGHKTSHHITAPNEEIAEGYFSSYVEALR